MIALIWPDGTEVVGDDATEVLAELAARQWSPLDVEQMKGALSDRAWSMLDALLDPLAPDDEFVIALGLSGMCAVDYRGDPAKPGKGSELTAPGPSTTVVDNDDDPDPPERP